MPQTSSITLEEMRNAERSVIQFVQRRHFLEEITALDEENKTGGGVQDTKKRFVKKPSSISDLDTVMTDGLLRVGGRLRCAPLDDSLKFPVILPRHHHLVNLIVKHYHDVSGHSGREHVLGLIRQQFWIIKRRVTVRRVLKSCFSCRRRQQPPCQQRMADLPVGRVTPDKPPFLCVGIDCFGPFMVKRARSEVKRGAPEEIRSDNGTNFTGAERELKVAIAEWNHKTIHEFLLQRDVRWIYNPPAASHMGGVWERNIRTVRKVLAALLKQQVLDDEGLATLFAEVEAIVNGRPLTGVSDDPQDMEALTPNHLLLMRAGSSLPPGVFSKENVYSRRRWKQVQYLPSSGGPSRNARDATYLSEILSWW
ncbi:uncharacterized protein LOC125561765 [Nematostella vectensis]|uniref:uncharacterized protein LOC125561765 n=1 Tax=Nematostella vectensis TaxID=45351 RepID=UPI0013903F9C|nr:uncharacterized protein LOC125561765 [Nematostella vectensis]